ncbi:Scarecrow-like protein 31 [Carex littledalei]|uniref:Scarecrow-like protein 31 n=1 Tax=Carex littledalei TaxID=544730 RepID=A0A833VPL4_9POAL|nr:Scarecrow-like protein 31 [Carex littledalei]
MEMESKGLRLSLLMHWKLAWLVPGVSIIKDLLLNESAFHISFLKGYHLYLKAAPFARVYYCFSNHNILNAAKNSRKLHVIDLGIALGFQWPSLIQALSKREGRPPQLRITSIEFPEPGFRPAKWVEDMGRRFEESDSSRMERSSSAWVCGSSSAGPVLGVLLALVLLLYLLVTPLLEIRALRLRLGLWEAAGGGELGSSGSTSGWFSACSSYRGSCA